MQRRIGIIDADLIWRKKHRFPNLASMKISAYHKSHGDNVQLCITYDDINKYDHIYISKVFSDTEIPEEVLKLENVTCGGTGFFYDKAPTLPDEIEHIMPDYHLYDDWVEMKKANGATNLELKYYTDFSIGFLTRGCFRQCSFCVNKNYKECFAHSPVSEFFDPSRPKLCFLDDNFFACPKWKDIIEEVKATNRRFEFKQGLDERLLTREKIDEIVSWKYNGDLIFAFDNIEDRELIESKLVLMKTLYPDFSRKMKFYVLCGYDRNGVYDKQFFLNDIRNTFERIKILMKYHAYPYIMRFEKAYTSEFNKIYVLLASWCNQPSMWAKTSFRNFCIAKAMRSLYSSYRNDPEKYLADGHKKRENWVTMENFAKQYQDIANDYFDIELEKICEYK